MGNPFDFDRDGRWSVPERAFTHYGVGPAARGGDDRPAGCGCLAALLALVLLVVLVLVL